METSNHVTQLKELQTYPLVWFKVVQSDEVEQRKIVMLMDRIKSKGGSIHHLIKYLNLVSF